MFRVAPYAKEITKHKGKGYSLLQVVEFFFHNQFSRSVPMSK